MDIHASARGNMRCEAVCKCAGCAVQAMCTCVQCSLSELADTEHLSLVSAPRSTSSPHAAACGTAMAPGSPSFIVRASPVMNRCQLMSLSCGGSHFFPSENHPFSLRKRVNPCMDFHFHAWLRKSIMDLCIHDGFANPSWMCASMVTIRQAPSFSLRKEIPQKIPHKL